MRNAIKFSTIFFQLLISLVTLFIIYMIFAILDNDEADMITGIGLLTLHPILAIIFSSITIAICLLIGLPIRLNSKLNKWWINKPYIAIIGGVLGMSLLILSLNEDFTQSTKVIINEEEVTKQIPNTNMALIGWFIICFSLLHFFPWPLISFIKNKVTRQKI